MQRCSLLALPKETQAQIMAYLISDPCSLASIAQTSRELNAITIAIVILIAEHQGRTLEASDKYMLPHASWQMLSSALDIAQKFTIDSTRSLVSISCPRPKVIRRRLATICSKRFWAEIASSFSSTKWPDHEHFGQRFLDRNRTRNVMEKAYLGNPSVLQLNCLDLSSNGTGLHESLTHLKCLTTLTLFYTRLPTFPEAICQLHKLQVLTITEPDLLTLSDNLGNLVSLKQLDLRMSHLSELPESIGQCSALETICIYESELTSLPESLGRCSELRLLSITKSWLTALPESISHCTKLRRLDLSYNKLQTLPQSIVDCRFLSMLDVSNNELNTLSDFEKTTALDFLDVSRNPLTELPE